MAYERQTWACGDTITADKLNHIEEGLEECCSGGGTSSEPLVGYVNRVGNSYTFSLTYEELAEAYSQGRTIIATAELDFDASVYGGAYSPIFLRNENDTDVFITTVFYYEGYNDCIVMLYFEIKPDNSVSITEKYVNLS